VALYSAVGALLLRVSPINSLPPAWIEENQKLTGSLGFATLVAENGVKMLEDGRRPRDTGADAMLVGLTAQNSIIVS
jgi:hypothetical protein